MALLLPKDLPRYECLLEAAREFPELDPTATEAFLQLLRTGDQAFRVVEAHLAEHEITQGRFSVLMSLWGKCHSEGRAVPLSPAEIADRLGVTRATVTGLVDTLERAGLVTRTPSADDRRMMLVQLTSRGEKLLGKILPTHFRQMAWLMQPLDESERKVFVQLLSKVLARAAERPASPPPDCAPAAHAS